ncbi:FAD dependent oxidoreductase [Myriangium duriaei CBS 260.36]|uniref:FAD dependent oxidoreductase n=1 Tax=Myriangium duriaei CBS 260.36 TaxID=1168546 RepID=A0A9P4IXN0_9PEZI|nr:FAD dependent oxidoreductase [Myriangium duriaei CBS 260.36]
MISSLSHSSSILIVGAGTWGCSTALHLARRGYTSIAVLDRYPVPSPISAGDDVNKIFERLSCTDESDINSSVSAKLSEAAYRCWKDDPIFSPYLHETGIISAAITPEALRDVEAGLGYIDGEPWIKLNSKDDFRATMPSGVLTGDFPGWQGWWRKSAAGWVHARKSMESAASEAKRLGVTFITGEQKGRVTSLLYQSGDVSGAVTADGTQHRADRTILSAGAAATEIFSMKDQLRPTAWTLAHIAMTVEELKLFKNLPVLFNAEQGFFMEPDEDNHELKICDEHPGYCNWTSPGVSTPFAKHQVPKESERRIRDFLRDTIPHLADRPFTFARLCWCADTPDRNFLISKHPDHPSLLLAVGGSGHGFWYIPAIGGFIVDALEDKLDSQIKECYKWRPETASHRNWQDKQGRFGPPGSNRVMDLGDVYDWTSIEQQQNERTNDFPPQ